MNALLILTSVVSMSQVVHDDLIDTSEMLLRSHLEEIEGTWVPVPIRGRHPVYTEFTISGKQISYKMVDEQRNWIRLGTARAIGTWHLMLVADSSVSDLAK